MVGGMTGIELLAGTMRLDRISPEAVGRAARFACRVAIRLPDEQREEPCAARSQEVERSLEGCGIAAVGCSSMGAGSIGGENYCGNLLWQSSLTLLPPRENCTYGSMRGRAFPTGRPALLYTLLNSSQNESQII